MIEQVQAMQREMNDRNKKLAREDRLLEMADSGSETGLRT